MTMARKLVATKYRVRIEVVHTFEITGKRIREKVADTGNELDNGSVYDWIDDPNTYIDKDSNEIYDQTVEALDVVAVIQAVNRIHETGAKK